MSALLSYVSEVEHHVAEAGWDQPPQLFALVETEALIASEPALASSMGLVAPAPGHLTPIAQDALPDGPLDEVLAGLSFTTDVLGVVLVQEVLILPPSAEGELAAALDDDPARVAAAAAGHDERREVRLVVGVVRDGTRACLLRLRRRPTDPPGPDERVTGPDLAPPLAEALLQTLEP